MATSFVYKPKAFYRRIEVRNRLGGEIIETMEWKNMRMDTVLKWEWYFKYRAALLQVKYPKYRVDFIKYSKEPVDLTKEQIQLKQKKSRTTTCKRMITKINNKILQYEAEQNKTLLPDWENEHYLKAKRKLSNYKKELKCLT